MSDVYTPSAAIKLEQLAAMLERGSAIVVADGRAISGLPERLRLDPTLHLRIGYELRPDINLVLGALGFTCTLSFERVLFDLQIPWSSVFVLIGEDSPKMVISFPESSPQVEALDAPPKPRGMLRSVD